LYKALRPGWAEINPGSEVSVTRQCRNFDLFAAETARGKLYEIKIDKLFYNWYNIQRSQRCDCCEKHPIMLLQ